MFPPHRKSVSDLNDSGFSHYRCSSDQFSTLLIGQIDVTWSGPSPVSCPRAAPSSWPASPGRTRRGNEPPGRPSPAPPAGGRWTPSWTQQQTRSCFILHHVWSSSLLTSLIILFTLLRIVHDWKFKKKKIRLKYEIFLFYYHHLSSLLNYWNLIIDYYLLNSVKQPRFGLFLHFFSMIWLKMFSAFH